MNTPRLFTLVFVFMLAVLAVPSLQAQEGGIPPQEGGTPPAKSPTNDNAPVDTSGSAIVAEYDVDFDNVFKIVKIALAEIGYPENYASKKRRLIETAFRPLSEQDGFFETMSEYGEVPYIRSPGWTVGRAKMMVTFETLENGKVTVKVLGQLSGFEGRFTNIWHYWKSNGRLEQEAMDAINVAIDRENAAAGGAGNTSSN